ncbi:hypothetical protein NL676_016143 [Syzygium grande]|nr:hypothetical protein NL676_016143 [Syzygium grande]
MLHMLIYIHRLGASDPPLKDGIHYLRPKASPPDNVFLLAIYNLILDTEIQTILHINIHNIAGSDTAKSIDLPDKRDIGGDLMGPNSSPKRS